MRRRIIVGLMSLGLLFPGFASAYTFSFIGDPSGQILTWYWQSNPPYSDCYTTNPICANITSSNGKIPLTSGGNVHTRVGGMIDWATGPNSLRVLVMTTVRAGPVVNDVNGFAWTALDLRDAPLAFRLTRELGEPAPLFADLYIRPRLRGTFEYYTYPASQGNLLLQLAMAVKVNGTQVSRDSLYTQIILAEGPDTTFQAAFPKGTANYVMLPAVSEGSEIEMRIWAYMQTAADYPASIRALWLDGPTVREGPAIEIEVLSAQSVAVSDESPGALSLAAHPNPSAGATKVWYALPRASRVTIALYDVAGHRRATLVDRVEEAGRHQMDWGGRDSQGSRLAPGVYFMEVLAGGERTVRRVVLMQ